MKVGGLTGAQFLNIGGGPLPASLSDWVPYWYRAGIFVRSAKAWPVQVDDKIERANGEVYRGLYVTGKNSNRPKIDALVLCPPLTDLEPNDCALPGKYHVSVDSPLISKPRDFATLEALESEYGTELVLISAETRDAEAADKIRRDIAQKSAEKWDAERQEKLNQTRNAEAALIGMEKQRQQRKQDDWIQRAKKVHHFYAVLDGA